MAIKLGVSLYSYQQSQFFKELDLEAQIREVGENLPGANGIEIVDEMSLRYPDPGAEFVERWFGWMDRYQTVPVTMDVSFDVLQFRDHVMDHEECAERLRHDLRLAKRLGFRNVRVLSTCPLDVMIRALPLAEQLDIRLGKEIHQPMPLEGSQVTEILEFVARTGTRHLGIVPDFGIFQTRPPQVILDQFERRGASPKACAASVELAEQLTAGQAPFAAIDMSYHTAGNLRSGFKRYLNSGECEAEFRAAFSGISAITQECVAQPCELDYTVVVEALMLSRTNPDLLRQMAPQVVSIHGKFNYMSEVPGSPGTYEDAAMDYCSPLQALQAGGFDGYINSEYEGQRYFQDRTRAEMMDEVEQVRRHHEMLRRLLGV
ncbi:sugar phosphate isomerase/epimerase family protein [Pseudomonas sp. NPDC090592]|uniref:sugar phosphate isomerase/epimerase family protein n=1 Tax=Pseudomonas sp. NPDC090592 TaxID=3364480 RepID=UPI00383A46D8